VVFKPDDMAELLPLKKDTCERGFQFFSSFLSQGSLDIL
jgi:hypothetical protein